MQDKLEVTQWTAVHLDFLFPQLFNGITVASYLPIIKPVYSSVEPSRQDVMTVVCMQHWTATSSHKKSLKLRHSVDWMLQLSINLTCHFLCEKLHCLSSWTQASVFLSNSFHGDCRLQLENALLSFSTVSEGFFSALVVCCSQKWESLKQQTVLTTFNFFQQGLSVKR